MRCLIRFPPYGQVLGIARSVVLDDFPSDSLVPLSVTKNGLIWIQASSDAPAPAPAAAADDAVAGAATAAAPAAPAGVAGVAVVRRIV